jgi:hypothetical protein
MKKIINRVPYQIADTAMKEEIKWTQNSLFLMIGSGSPTCKKKVDISEKKGIAILVILFSILINSASKCLLQNSIVRNIIKTEGQINNCYINAYLY